MTHRELLAMLILVMTMVYVAAIKMLVVPSVTHVLMATTATQLALVSCENLRS